MSRTVTALYDNKAEAEAARDRLASTVDLKGRAKIIDKSSASGSGHSSALNGLGLSDEDRHSYGEGIRRGGYLLCAEVDGHEDADRIIALLEETSSVDLDERQDSWRKEGWQGAAGGSASSTGSVGGQTSLNTGLHTGLDTGRTVEEQHIPIVEEQLVVGKREVNRGGARVRSYIREVPVHEQVTLREEHVSVERRPVEQTLERGILDREPDLLRDRTIEMSETAEEAVVAKKALVREEVVVRKTAEQRTEQIDDTVRRTEVEVDEGRSGSAFGFDSSKDNSASDRSLSETTRSVPKG